MKDLKDLKLTRQNEKDIIKDTLIDWMDNNNKDNMIELIANILVSKQRKDIMNVLENEYSSELNKALIGLGLIEE